MLVLGREAGQRFYIGDDITIKVIEITKFGDVRIGIDAPKGMLILREELYEKEKPIPQEA